MDVHSGTTATEIIEYTIKHNPDFKYSVKSKPKNNPNRLKELTKKISMI